MPTKKRCANTTLQTSNRVTRSKVTNIRSVSIQATGVLNIQQVFGKRRTKTINMQALGQDLILLVSDYLDGIDLCRLLLGGNVFDNLPSNSFPSLAVFEERAKEKILNNPRFCGRVQNYVNGEGEKLFSLMKISPHLGYYLGAVNSSPSTMLAENYKGGQECPTPFIKLLVSHFQFLKGNTEKAARLGHPLAQFDIAMGYMQGSENSEFNSVRYEKCLMWLISAAPVHPIAMFCLGTCIAFPDEQINTPKYTLQNDVDFTLIKELYRHAANGGIHAAMVNMGMIHYGRFPGIPLKEPVDINQTISWWKAAAEHRQVEAQLNLGHIFMKGEYVTQNTTEACKWFELASRNNGDTRGKYLFGKALAEGTGVPQDVARAKLLLQDAMSQNDHPLIALNAATILSDLAYNEN